MTIKLTHRADGTAVVEHIPGEYDSDWHDDNMLSVGDEGTLVERERVTQPVGIIDVYIDRNDGGARGNMSSARCYHGWRGTTNDIARHAHGWRRVEAITPRKRGRGYRVTFSRDLKPDQD
jgi:hypothetical protein